jgi:hypothetical protein
MAWAAETSTLGAPPDLGTLTSASPVGGLWAA